MTLKLFYSQPILFVLLISLFLNLVPSGHAATIADRNLTQYINEFNVPTPQSAPLAITVDGDGIVWFTESNMSKLGRFDPLNQSFREFRVPDVGDMWGVASDREGRIWITQYAGRGAVNPGGAIVAGGSGRLLTFDPAKNSFSIVNIPTNSSFPMRLAIDKQDRVWFTEFLGNKIGMYDQADERLSEYQIPTNESGPADLTFSKGDLWFTEAYAQSVGEFFPNNQSFIEYHVGEQTPSMIVSSPVGIAVDAKGNVWVGDHGGNWIVEFNPTTRQVNHYVTHTPPEEIYPLSIPNGMLVDGEGRVWFAEHGGNSVGYYDPTNKSMVEYSIPTGPVATTLWIALAPNGEIWFTEWSADKIGVVHANLPIPFAIHLSVSGLIMGAGQQQSSVSVTVDISQPRQGNGTWGSSWSSYGSTDISVTFIPQYPSMNGTSSFTIARIALSNSVSPGNYSLSIGIDTANIRVRTLAPVQVLPTSEGGPNTYYVWLSEIILLASAIVVIMLIRRRRLRLP